MDLLGLRCIYCFFTNLRIIFTRRREISKRSWFIFTIPSLFFVDVFGREF